jgi:hypothetical protein
VKWQSTLRRAPKAAAADLVRLSTSAPDISEECAMGPNYLDSFVKPRKLGPFQPGPGTSNGIVSPFSLDPMFAG